MLINNHENESTNGLRKSGSQKKNNSCMQIKNNIVILM